MTETSIIPLLTFLGLACWAYGAFMLLMVIMQLTRVDYYNPIAQWIAKITSPVLTPLRKLIPHYQRLDVSALIATIILNACVVTIVIYKFELTAAAANKIAEDISLIYAVEITARLIAGNLLDIFTITLVGHAIMSWFGEKAYHSPTGRLFGTINEPLVGPIRNAIMGKGGIGGLDFSPMIVIIGIFFIRRMIEIDFLYGLQLVSA